jgi:hypothetical protein
MPEGSIGSISAPYFRKLEAVLLELGFHHRE